MAKILNVTQHQITENQSKAGVFEPIFEDKERIKILLTFEEIPSILEMNKRAIEIIKIISNYNVDRVMIGGAPYFMSILEKVLKENKIKPLYSFSKRVSKEVEKDGVVTKVNMFEHQGFVKV